MAREVWGTYSVRDHLGPQPWAADVILYDRLVVPVPPDRAGPEGAQEWNRWEHMGWAPDRQRQLLTILGNRAMSFEWNAQLRQQWSILWHESLAQLAETVTTEARRPSLSQPYQMTPQVLMTGLPARVTAVNAVATFRSLLTSSRTRFSYVR